MRLTTHEARGRSLTRAIRRAVSLPRTTPRKDEGWIA